MTDAERQQFEFHEMTGQCELIQKSCFISLLYCSFVFIEQDYATAMMSASQEQVGSPESIDFDLDFNLDSNGDMNDEKSNGTKRSFISLILIYKRGT